MNSSERKTARLFERIPSPEYVQEWTDALMKESKAVEEKGSLSVLVFRLGDELFAIQTIFVKEVAKSRQVHRVPHRSGQILEGLVNLNGELQLTVALHRLLMVEREPQTITSQFAPPQDRFIAIIKEGEMWVFAVDGIEGIFSWNIADIENVPVNISKSSVNYIKGIMKMGNKRVGLLDDELLFPSLKRSVS